MIEEAYLQKNYFLIKYLFSALLKYLLDEKPKEQNNFNDKRVYELIKLLEENFKNEKNASFYAKKLALSTKRLNELTKKYLYQTTSELIINRVIIEVKRQLFIDKKTVIQISEELGFMDSSYFSKYFKKHTGLSPIQFKKEKNR